MARSRARPGEWSSIRIKADQLDRLRTIADWLADKDKPDIDRDTRDDSVVPLHATIEYLVTQWEKRQ